MNAPNARKGSTKAASKASPELELEPAQHHALQTITPQPAPLAAPAQTPFALIEQALARGAPIELVEKLMDLKDRHEADEARKAFVASMTAFKKNPPEILKRHQADYVNRNGGRTTYSYADLPDVCDALTASLAEQGISHDWSTAQSGDLVSVTCTITHELGHSKSTTLTAGADTTGSKNAIQAIGSAVSYLERYTLLAVCGIAVRDGSDDDGNPRQRRAGVAPQVGIDGLRRAPEARKQPAHARGRAS